MAEEDISRKVQVDPESLSVAEQDELACKLDDTFRRYGYDYHTQSLLQQGASFFKMPRWKLDSLLENTFIEHGVGTDVRFLLDHGVSFSEVSLSKLPESSFREWGYRIRVEFLVDHGVSFSEASLNKLLKQSFCE